MSYFKLIIGATHYKNETVSEKKKTFDLRDWLNIDLYLIY